MTVDLFTKPKNGFACGGTARLKSAKGESEGAFLSSRVNSVNCALRIFFD